MNLSDLAREFLFDFGVDGESVDDRFFDDQVFASRCFVKSHVVVDHYKFNFLEHCLSIGLRHDFACFLIAVYAWTHLDHQLLKVVVPVLRITENFWPNIIVVCIQG